jgi:hypothetical protein
MNMNMFLSIYLFLQVLMYSSSHPEALKRGTSCSSKIFPESLYTSSNRLLKSLLADEEACESTRSSLSHSWSSVICSSWSSLDRSSRKIPCPVKLIRKRSMPIFVPLSLYCAFTFAPAKETASRMFLRAGELSTRTLHALQ